MQNGAINHIDIGNGDCARSSAILFVHHGEKLAMFGKTPEIMRELVGRNKTITRSVNNNAWASKKYAVQFQLMFVQL